MHLVPCDNVYFLKFNPKVYLEHCQISVIGIFCKSSWMHSVVNYFCKKGFITDVWSVLNKLLLTDLYDILRRLLAETLILIADKTDHYIMDTIKLFDDFKNNEKSVWINLFWYAKVYIYIYIYIDR